MPGSCAAVVIVVIVLDTAAAIAAVDLTNVRREVFMARDCTGRAV
jgi:hydrogenase maturation factor